ncbi:MAG TPA: hypothetical protein VGF90_04925 [Verrucomicrobiae bacterium]
MHRFLMMLFLVGSLSAAAAADASTGYIVKMLPLLLDMKGHDAQSPSLYDRDAYQVYLREHTNDVSAIHFDVLWRAVNVGEAKLKLRLELHGIGPDNLPRQTTLEQSVEPHFFRHWTSIPLASDDYKKFGNVVAWRVTLWADDRMLGKQESFLWRI